MCVCITSCIYGITCTSIMQELDFVRIYRYRDFVITLQNVIINYFWNKNFLANKLQFIQNDGNMDKMNFVIVKFARLSWWQNGWGTGKLAVCQERERGNSSYEQQFRRGWFRAVVSGGWEAVGRAGVSAGVAACGSDDRGVCDSGDHCGRRGGAFRKGFCNFDSGRARNVGADDVGAALSGDQIWTVFHWLRTAGDYGDQLCLCADDAGHCRGV